MKSLLVLLAVVFSNPAFAQEEKSFRFISMVDDDLALMSDIHFLFVKDSVQYKCNAKYEYGLLTMTTDDFLKIKDYYGEMLFRFRWIDIKKQSEKYYEIPLDSRLLTQNSYTILKVFNRKKLKYRFKYPRIAKDKNYYYYIKTSQAYDIVPVGYKKCNKETRKSRKRL